jgi:hypothetical protein
MDGRHYTMAAAAAVGLGSGAVTTMRSVWNWFSAVRKPSAFRIFFKYRYYRWLEDSCTGSSP